MPVRVKKRPKKLVKADQADPDTLYEIVECSHSEMIGYVAEICLGYDYELEELVPENDHFIIIRSDMAVYRRSKSWDSLVLRPLDPGDILEVVD